jgi:hypothetical protein
MSVETMCIGETESRPKKRWEKSWYLYILLLQGNGRIGPKLTSYKQSQARIEHGKEGWSGRREILGC